METADLYSSNFNLLMLNVWIGLCKGVRGFPKDIRALGYQHHSTEQRFVNSKGGTVIPELIIISAKLEHSILFEWKKGPNADKDQLDRYEAITSDDLRTKAFVPSPAYLTHDVAIVGKDEHAERLRIAVSKHHFPLLLVTRNKMWIEVNQFTPAELNSTFSPHLEIDISVAPISFVKFNEESSDWEIAEKVMQYVVQRMVQRASEISLDEICNEQILGWGNIAPDRKTVFKQRIHEVMNQASKNEFKRFLQKNFPTKRKKKTPIWDIRNNPLEMLPSKRAAGLKRLRTAQKLFIQALQTGRRPDPQIDAFDD